MSGIAANALTGIISAFQTVAQSNEVPLKTIVLALLLYGVKEFLNDIIFTCPEEHFAIYGSLFIFGPSILVFCLSLLVSSPFWQVVTGCLLLRRREKKLLLLKSKNSVFVACLPPVIWLVYAFVEQDYYVCAKLGRLDTALARANTTALKDAVNKEFSHTKVVSELIAWGLILGLVVISTIFVTVYRMCMPIDPKLQGEYAFHEYEADKAVSHFNEKIKPLAEQDALQIVDSLFEKNKDKSHVEQIKTIESQLKEMFPRHAGVLNGPVRVETNTYIAKPDPTVHVPPSYASGDMELQPMVEKIHA